MNRRGFTLVETLVAMSVAAIVLVGLAVAVRGLARSAIFQLGTADMQQNVRGALELFKREVRMAGFGMAAVPLETLAPVQVMAPGAGDLYRLRLRGNYGNVRSAGSTEGATVTLDPAAAPFPVFTVGKKLAIKSEILGLAEVRTISAYNAGTGTITLSADLAEVYDSGSPVDQLDDLTYRLDGSGLLWRQVDAGLEQVAADQVDLLQLSYVLADGTMIADPAAALQNLRGATMRMHSQRSALDGMQPKAELSTQVRIRNLGIVTAPEA